MARPEPQSKPRPARRLAPALAFLAGCGMGLDAFAPDAAGDTAVPPGDGGGATGDGGGIHVDTGGDGGAGDGGGGDTGGIAIAIDRLDPDYATTAGGTTVTIEGGPFDDSAIVWFGGERAQVTSVTPDTLVVVEPGSAVEQVVDVAVQTDAGAGTAPEAFRYYADASGEAAALGVLAWFEMVGGYWSGPVADPWGSAAIYFVQPADFHWWQLYAGAIDSCAASDYSPSDVPEILDPDVASITLTPSSGSPITATWDPAYSGFLDDELTPAQWVDNADYALTMSGSTWLPDFEAAAFARAAGKPTVTVPAIMGSTPPRINRAQTFQWNTDPADWVLIWLRLWNADGSDVEEEIFCVAANDGSFTVSSTTWTSWPTGRQVDVLFGRVREATGTLPYNHGDSRVVGTYFVYGAGFSQ